MRAIKTLLISSAFMLCALQAVAGGPPPPTTTTGGDPSCWPPPCIPVDGGIGLLMAAGALYGAKKFHEKRKQGRRGS